MNKKTNKAPVLATAAVALCLALLFSPNIFFIKQKISDYINVWSYKPSTVVMSFAERTGLSDNGTFLYLASQPVLDGTQLFNDECNNVENVASILGCYKDNRIYIYDVNDEKLDGIREVTAAHEMLHAAYARLNEKEKNKVNKLLRLEYEKIKDDENFKSRMEFYARTEPGQINNELHSVIGTEMASISPELEEYYSRYFEDRQRSVGLNSKYLSVFAELDKHAKEILSSRDDLAQSINDRTQRYNQEIRDLDSDIIDFNFRSNNSYFESENKFNDERDQLMARKTKLNNDRDYIMQDIDQSNVLLLEYNSIATETKKLYNSLDSTLAPVPSI